jgi:hypothetical protein
LNLYINIDDFNYNIYILEEDNYKYILKTGILVPLSTIVASHPKTMAKVLYIFNYYFIFIHFKTYLFLIKKFI